ncbi:unnamed protein product [Candidula unifasciata]|uniref:Iron-binding zinc finger CDGSH type domain-containing protein n=1 Tax=Candidula unifasciata TaxID=100452 RepID=A0A8S3ZF61_9EUPU|nr:unnamed protein product [Candidula unifasciata]
MRAPETSDLVTYIPILTSIGLALYVIWHCLRPKADIINPNIKKTEEKVVDTMNVDDIKEDISFCRCWRSQEFPLCDGSHNEHNKKTGDNVGPMCLRKQQKKTFCD